MSASSALKSAIKEVDELYIGLMMTSDQAARLTDVEKAVINAKSETIRKVLMILYGEYKRNALIQPIDTAGICESAQDDRAWSRVIANGMSREGRRNG